METELWALILQGGGVTALLLLILLLGRRRVWVWATELDRVEREMDRVRQEREEWQRLALELLGVTEAMARREIRRRDDRPPRGEE